MYAGEDGLRNDQKDYIRAAAVRLDGGRLPSSTFPVSKWIDETGAPVSCATIRAEARNFWEVALGVKGMENVVDEGRMSTRKVAFSAKATDAGGRSIDKSYALHRPEDKETRP